MIHIIGSDNGLAPNRINPSSEISTDGLNLLTDICTYMRHSTSMSYYRQTSNISRTLVGTKIVDHSDVVGASPVGADSTTSSFST